MLLEQLIKECKKYNKLAQRLLYEKYAPAMNGICMRYIPDREVVKDIVQDGFIKVFASIKQYNGTGSFEGWMKRIFVNTAISHLRKSKGKKFLNIDDIEEKELSQVNITSYESAEELSTDLGTQNNFQIVLAADFSEIELLDVLTKLPDKYRLVFNLFCIENFKHEEIAEMLKIDTATSRTRLMRAREMVKKELYALSLIKTKKG